MHFYAVLWSSAMPTTSLILNESFNNREENSVTINYFTVQQQEQQLTNTHKNNDGNQALLFFKEVKAETFKRMLIIFPLLKKKIVSLAIRKINERKVLI